MIIKNNNGSTAIEFAILLPIFLFLNFIILQSGFDMISQVGLNSSLDETTRRIETGSLCKKDITALKTDICERNWAKAFSLLNNESCIAKTTLIYKQYPLDQAFKSTSSLKSDAEALLQNNTTEMETGFIKANHVVLFKIVLKHKRILSNLGQNNDSSYFNIFNDIYISSFTIFSTEHFNVLEKCA